MKVIKNCSTCEYNSHGVCVDKKKGEEISKFVEIEKMDCWTIDEEYHDDLIERLPLDMKKEYVYNIDTKLTLEDIIKYIEEDEGTVCECD